MTRLDELHDVPFKTMLKTIVVLVFGMTDFKRPTTNVETLKFNFVIYIELMNVYVPYK